MKRTFAQTMMRMEMPKPGQLVMGHALSETGRFH